MAFTLTPYTGVAGNLRTYYGTFTSAAGDNTLTITHGLNHVATSRVSVETGGIGVSTPKVTHSAGVTTAVWDDTRAYSGSFYITGR